MALVKIMVPHTAPKQKHFETKAIYSCVSGIGKRIIVPHAAPKQKYLHTIAIYIV